ncbi:DUF1122 domain-containing protein [Saccharolobus solfataricus]|uniref:DUF1122 domain-containing protein n=3 Tax=Saccharolobus solfataricus TaxID=2287 RepID=Q7LXZ5_SACS2|nr:DUF1122 family protein [Saccharolobus solfataricus]AAK40445.1 Conserved hypothetical protein [Saccharolobus solfataricus P2]AKA73431.1 DUF1122 domain-containing protein [Saccharolobus solfataricus]AKA76129.1 DUF1122 domain-containing protein [Saccharolobus solfataricus]AKA78821.1 DUF1122 domain-containing protein [Saccharolobus solfataricus]AZF67896.1 DUF1122 domain-containing protein [Saccharolobus solfataricus]
MSELNGVNLSAFYKLEVRNLKNTHIKELVSFDLLLSNGRQIGKCNYFKGRDYYTPWLEIDYYPILRNENLEVIFFKVVYNFLSPGGKLFVTYIRDNETRERLYIGKHPVETPLGFSLLSAGFTWFKDWYFPEGGNEGFPKLQANKPINSDEGIRQLETIREEIKNVNVIRKIDELIDHYRKSRDRTVYWEIT